MDLTLLRVKRRGGSKSFVRGDDISSEEDFKFNLLIVMESKCGKIRASSD